MLETAVNYPRQGDEAIKTILIGGVLTLLSFLVVPIFLVYGYAMRVLRASMADEEEPPVFEEWGGLLVEGLKAFVVVVVYLILPTIVFAVSAGGAIASVFTGDVSPAALGGALAGLGIATILALLFYYVIPAALANMAQRDSLGAAFAFGDLKPVLFSGTYAKGWLFALVVLVAAGVVAGLLSLVPLLGAIVAVFVQFYALVAVFYIYGRAFVDAGGAGGDDRSASGAGQATA